MLKLLNGITFNVIGVDRLLGTITCKLDDTNSDFINKWMNLILSRGLSMLYTGETVDIPEEFLDNSFRIRNGICCVKTDGVLDNKYEVVGIWPQNRTEDVVTFQTDTIK